MRSILATTTALLMLLPGAASAQNALGDGRALDQNVERTAPRDRGAAARRLNDEIRFRNAIVTGNAPGGLSFRGDIPYAASGEFRGDLGSNDLFSFRRDSFYSGLSGQGIRGVEALQYQFALTTRSEAPGELLGSPIIERSGSGATAGDVIRRQPEPARRVRDSQLFRLDPRDVEDDGSLLGTLRATSAYTSTRSLQPRILGYQRDEDGRLFGLTASSLEGIRSRALAGFEDGFQSELQEDGIEQPSDSESGRAGEQPSRPGRIDQRVDEQVDQRIDQRVDQRVGREGTRVDPTATMHDYIVSRLLEEAEAAGMDPEKLGRDLTELRRALADFRQQEAEQSGDEQEDQPNQGFPSQPGDALPEVPELPEQPEGTSFPDRPTPPGPTGEDLRPTPNIPGLTPRPSDEEEEEGEEEQRRAPGEIPTITPPDQFADLLQRIRDTNARLSNLVAPDSQPRDIYALHMQHGERLMSEGRFFDAEERFTRALAARPSDVAAQIGRVHAQLGAGLYLSAAVNLRKILSSSPEVAAIQYADRLLPSGERAETIRAQLTANVSAAELTDDNRLGTESALLMAYLGFQSDDREAIETGLDALDASDINADRALVRMLGALWLEPASANDKTEAEPADEGSSKPDDAASDDGDG